MRRPLCVIGVASLATGSALFACSSSTGTPAHSGGSPPGSSQQGASSALATGAGAGTDGGTVATTSSGSTGAPDSGGPSAGGVLPADRIIDWSHAGVVQPNGTQGIPTITTQCATIDAATYGSGSTDVSAALQSAVDACPAGQAVFLPAGTYLLAKPVTVNRSVVLRGAGPSTKIVESGANIEFGATPASNPTTLYEANWTAGYTKGTTTITLDNTSHLTVGQVVVLDQLNDTNVTTPGYVPLVNPTGNEGTVGVGVNDCASRNGLSFCTDGTAPVPRALMQMAEVTAINGNNVSLDRPVYITHLAGLSPQAFFWRGGNLSYAGIESLRIDAQYTNQAVDFSFCTNCWAKAIEVDHIARGAVSLWYDDHFELRDSYFYMNQAAAPTNYGVEVDDTGASLLENNIFDNITIGCILSWSSNGNVVGYNYSVNESPGSQDLGGAHGTHSVHAFMNLFEGNYGGKLGFDYVWGSGSDETLFRNRLTGYLPPRTSTSGPGLWSNGNWPLFIEAWNRAFNVVGNVLGTDGVANGYQAADVDAGALVGATGYSTTCACCSCGMGVAPIYVLGYWDSWQAASQPGSFDSLVASTLWRWGNYDYYTKRTHWDPAEIPSGESVPTTQALPASLYRNSEPAWFGSAVWPPIGPDVPTLANPLPAQLCYQSESVGSGGTFDPSKCY